MTREINHFLAVYGATAAVGNWHARARNGGGQLSPIIRIPSFVSQLTAMLDVSAAGMCIHARMTGGWPLESGPSPWLATR